MRTLNLYSCHAAALATYERSNAMKIITIAIVLLSGIACASVRGQQQVPEAQVIQPQEEPEAHEIGE